MRLIDRLISSNITRMVTALFVCGVFSAAVLVFVYETTKPGIQRNQEMEMRRAIEDIFPEADEFREIDGDLFSVHDTHGNVEGYAFIASGNGYQGEIKLLVGVQSDLRRLRGIAVLESQETPGLGGEIQSDEFLLQFRDLDVSRSVEYVRNRPPQQPHKIEAITGATISSSAVVRIINEKLTDIRNRLGVD